MIIQLKKNITTEQKLSVIQAIEKVNYQVNEVKTQYGHYLIAVGKKEFDIRKIGQLKGIDDIHRVTDSYKLVSKKWRVHDTDVDLGDGIHVNRQQFSIIAGPCSIESPEQIDQTIEHLKTHNIRMMRGGVFKPRTSPYAFRGVGLEGLKIFSEKCRAAGIKVVT
jgi:3-deoxy-7-phosphoheptulonate synthase